MNIACGISQKAAHHVGKCCKVSGVITQKAGARLSYNQGRSVSESRIKEGKHMNRNGGISKRPCRSWFVDWSAHPCNRVGLLLVAVDMLNRLRAAAEHNREVQKECRVTRYRDEKKRERDKGILENSAVG